MPKQSRIQCLDRTMDILERLGEKGEMGVTELAQDVGLNVATVHNIVTTLAARQYLMNDNGRYMLGPAFAVLAGRWNPLSVLPRLAQPYLEQVTAETGESAVTAVIVGTSAFMVAFTLGTDEVTTQFPRQMYPHPLILSTGRVLVAYSDNHQQEEMVKRYCANSQDEEARWSLAEWLREFAHIRQQGFTAIHRPNPNTLSSMAVPVWGPGDGQPIAALGASCPAFRASDEHLNAMQRAITKAAHSLSHELGHREMTPIA
ncbi:MAG TPA: IclR family transcriptional regulator C-terminal domain-containing protein [Armatimonadota bacterium]|nr:IclR family transcriptional regulator C-terminal domain-containing protein [Armatimonadota bacterium]